MEQHASQRPAGGRTTPAPVGCDANRRPFTSPGSRSASRPAHPCVRRGALVALVALVALTPAAAIRAQRIEPIERTPEQLRIARAARGWIDLLPDGSTAAWREYGADRFPDEGWRVRDGILHHDPGDDGLATGVDIVTRRRFGNFEFRFDWRVATGSNSGVLYRVAEIAPNADETGFEYQILDDEGIPGASTTQNAGALYGLYESLGKRLEETGEWNTGRIVCLDDHIEHWLNGVKVVEAPLGSDDWRETLAGSKFAGLPWFGRFARGHLCLQGLDEAVSFRRLFVRELPPTGARAGTPENLLDGSFDAWVPRVPGDVDPSTVWSLDDDGELVCTGTLARAYLHTRESYASFLLSFEWKFDEPEPHARPEALVLLRLQPPHRIWPRAFAVALGTGHAGDLTSIDGMPMKTAVPRRIGTTAERSHDAEAPLGSWNRLQVVVDGSWIQVILNGHVVNEAWDCAMHAGPIGLTCEGAALRLRNLVVTPIDSDERAQIRTLSGVDDRAAAPR